MFNNANVLFKTKFVDGVSTVTRYVQNQPGARPVSVTTNNIDKVSVTKKKGKTPTNTKRARMQSDLDYSDTEN
jgi:hypothetical protein